MPWKVRVIEAGRSGRIEYVENGQTCACYWEFGGGDTIAILSVPSAEDWDTQYPWASGRRREVLERIARETRRQRAPRSVIEWDEPRNCIYLREKGGAQAAPR